MKKIFSLFMLCLATLSTTFAQDCKSVKTEVDKFTKKETKVGTVSFGKIKVISFKGSTKWQFNVNQEAGKTNITTTISALGEFNQILDATTFFYFLLNNGEVVKLANKANAKPVTQAIASGGSLTVFTTYLLTLEPTESELKALADSDVTDVKVDIPNQKILSPEVGAKDAKTFKSIIACMLQSAT